MEYPLEQRVIKFGLLVIKQAKVIRLTIYNKNIIEQVLRSATSVGANYHEANGAISRNDFKTKIAICKKEALETNYWIRILVETESQHIEELHTLEKECTELSKIFSSILKKLNKE